MKKYPKTKIIILFITLSILLVSCKTNNNANLGKKEKLPYEIGNRFEYPNQKIQSFDYLGVELLDSPLKKQYDATIDFFLSIPNDDLLLQVRQRAGVDADGNIMNGWFSGGGFCGSTFGQWLSAFSRFYAVTKDERIKEKATYLMEEWGSLIEDDGFFYFNPIKSANTWHYTYDKMVLGLTDMYVYMGNNNAIKYLEKITDWAAENLRTKKRLPSPESIVGEFSPGTNDNEWYTLPENLYRAYLATGNEKFLNFADEWLYDTYFNALRNQDNSYWTGLHAYSHVNVVGSAALAYMVKGDEKYKDTIIGFYEAFSKYEFFPSGGYGVGEGLQGDRGTLVEDLRNNINTFETPCSTWAAFKLGRYLIGSTGEAKYGDWIEKSVYNGIYAALPMEDTEAKRGKTFYYANYTDKSGSKEYFAAEWPCCSGTFPLSVSEYPNLIYMKDAESLYVNLFVPSKVTALYNDKLIELVQTTNYPEENQINFKVNCTDKVNVNLKIRVPGWTENDIPVEINGKKSKDLKIENGWLILGNEWKNGDEIKVVIPMEVKTEMIDEEYPEDISLMYGPVMLVAKDAQGAVINMTGENIEKNILRKEDGLAFYLKDDSGKEYNIVPFYSTKENEKYITFFKIKK